MDLAFTQYKDTARLILRAPDGSTYTTGDGEPMWVDLHSRRSSHFERAMSQWQRERPAKRRRKDPSYEEGRELTLRLIVACTAGWNLEMHGEPVPLDADTARAFWEQNPAFREQADVLMDDDEAFMTR